jgi:hydrogenase maturation protein HypF
MAGVSTDFRLGNADVYGEPGNGRELPSVDVLRHVSIAAAFGGPNVLALGGELKNTVCVLSGEHAQISEDLGDLTQPANYRRFVETVGRLRGCLAFSPDAVAHDLHPQYLSTRFAVLQGCQRWAVQHHHAHIASVMAEWNELGPVFGLACDGTGYGTDGAIWGCELLRCAQGTFDRVGHLEYFPLVGGDLAAREPWRPAAALLGVALGKQWRTILRDQAPEMWARFAPRGNGELDMFDAQIRHHLNAPPTSSLGRVFDAVAFLLGLCRRNQHEAQAAAALEAAAAPAAHEQVPFEYRIVPNTAPFMFSVAPMIVDLMRASRQHCPVAQVAARFHETVARMLAEAAGLVCRQNGVRTVALSGGCFANRLLVGRVTQLLESKGIRVLTNRRVPAGDGGISLGQAYVAMWRMR